MDFNFEKNGYSIKEVDKFFIDMKKSYEQTTEEQKIRISDLKRELEKNKAELNKFREKNSDISNALVVAVETAKQIESSSKNVYALEIKRLKNLYLKWEGFLNQLIEAYPQVGEKYDHKKILKTFSDKIDEIIELNNVELTEDNLNEPIGIRSLISKMGGIATRKPESVVIKRRDKTFGNSGNNESHYSLEIENDDSSKNKTNIQSNQQYEDFAEDLKNQDLELKIKPIANMTKGEKDKFDSLVEKFFQAPESENAYSKALIRQKKNSSGFDLKEALNPKEDLAQIMKDFDFFDD